MGKSINHAKELLCCLNGWLMLTVFFRKWRPSYRIVRSSYWEIKNQAHRRCYIEFFQFNDEKRPKFQRMHNLALPVYSRSNEANLRDWQKSYSFNPRTALNLVWSKLCINLGRIQRRTVDCLNYTVFRLKSCPADWKCIWTPSPKKVCSLCLCYWKSDVYLRRTQLSFERGKSANTILLFPKPGTRTKRRCRSKFSTIFMGQNKGRSAQSTWLTYVCPILR